MTADADERGPLTGRPSVIELPAPTAWPMVLALGVTLGCAGLVTNVVVSVVGVVLALIGGVGWWRQVLPVEQHGADSAASGRRARARRSCRRRPRVARRSLGEGGHRVRIPVEVQPLSAGDQGRHRRGRRDGDRRARSTVSSSSGASGIRSTCCPRSRCPAWRKRDMAMLRAFNVTALLLGIIAHGVISVLAGLLYAVILPMLPRRHMLWGGLVAPLLWTG